MDDPRGSRALQRRKSRRVAPAARQPAPAAQQPSQQPAQVETWSTRAGEQMQCELFAASDEAVVCGIMHEPTCCVAIEGLPPAWPGAPGPNSARLQCGHVFHPAALALHFLVADMRCPVCRVGLAETMDMQSVPAEHRLDFQKKLEGIERREKEEEERVEPASIADVLRDLELQVRLADEARELTSLRTPVVFHEEQIRHMTSAALQECNFDVHRSFQRLVFGLVNRQRCQYPERSVRFALQHPLVPVSMLSEPMNVAAVWRELLDPAQQHVRTPVPLFCPHVTGSEPVAHLRVAFSANATVPSVSIDVNVCFLLNIATYVSDVLESVRHAVEQHVSQFDSTSVLEITQHAVNGVELHPALP